MLDLSLQTFIQHSLNQEWINTAERIARSAAFVSDASGLTNAQKYEVISDAFNLSEGILTPIPMEEVDEMIVDKDSMAAAFICDLRSQFFEHYLEQHPDNLTAHELCLETYRWYAKFHARHKMDAEIVEKRGIRYT